MADQLITFNNQDLNIQFGELLRNITSDNFKGKGIPFPIYTDSNRPSPGKEGRVIFNSDDGNLNIDNGTDWILPDGTVT